MISTTLDSEFTEMPFVCVCVCVTHFLFRSVNSRDLTESVKQKSNYATITSSTLDLNVNYMYYASS